MLMTSGRPRSTSTSDVELFRRADQLELEGAIGVVLKRTMSEHVHAVLLDQLLEVVERRRPA